MFFRQYYLGCLSHASYLIGDTVTGQAVVVDPQRDTAQYVADADANGNPVGPTDARNCRSSGHHPYAFPARVL